MTYANQGPQHSGQNYSYGASHDSFAGMSPAERKRAEAEAQKESEQLERQNKLEKARHEKYAVDRAKGIFHPGDPQTKIVEITDPAKKGMSRAEQERRIKDGTLPPEFADLHALIESRKDPANQRPPVELRGFRGPSPQIESPQLAQAPKEMHPSPGHALTTPQTEATRVAQKTAQTSDSEAQPSLSKKDQRWQLSGSKAGETITVTQDPNRPERYSVRIETRGKVTSRGSITAEELNRLDLHGGDGRDVIALIGQMPEGMRVYGDAGQDMILKTEGNETLSIDGGKGVDRVLTATQRYNRSEFDLTPETPVQQFQRELKENARTALQSNRDRLKSQEQRYQDPNPNSPQWKALWHAASTREALDQKARSLHQEQEQVKAALAKPDALPKQSRLTVSEAEYRKDPAAQRYEQLSDRRAAILRELEQLKQSELELEYEFPALSAMGQESKNTRENNQAILGRIPQKFGEIRHSINDLDHQIQGDPKVALRLDKVVEQTLAAGVSFEQGTGVPEVAQVTEWLKAEGFWKHAATGAGIAATGVAGVASLFNPEVGWVAAALGFGTAAAQLPDALIDDRAAQAQRGGGEQVTSLDPDTARGNLVLGGVNLVLAGLDAGLQPEVLRGLVKIPGLARAGLALTNQQRRVLMASVARHSGAMTDAVLEKLVGAVKTADAQTTMIIANGDGTLTQMRPLGRVADGLEETTTARASAKAARSGQKKLKDMTPAERLAYSQDKYGQARNWDQVEPLMGQAINQQTKLPTGYRLLQKPASKQLFILRETADDASFVPLMIENGKIQAGKTRLSRGLDVMKKNLKGVGVDVPQDWQVNHLVPDAVAQSDPLMVEMLKRNLYDVDHAGNLLPMPGKADIREANPNLIGHQGSHENFNRVAQQRLKDETTALVEEYGNLSKVPDSELKQAVERAENSMRKGIVNRSPDIPTRYDPVTKTRVLSEGLSEPDFVA
jgi:A nuclease family of the HNH/ENDO VII superfamily with conserved AHH